MNILPNEIEKIINEFKVSLETHDNFNKVIWELHYDCFYEHTTYYSRFLYIKRKNRNTSTVSFCYSTNPEKTLKTSLYYEIHNYRNKQIRFEENDDYI